MRGSRTVSTIACASIQASWTLGNCFLNMFLNMGGHPGISGGSLPNSQSGAPIRCPRYFHYTPTMYGRRRYLMPLKGAKPFTLPKIDAHFGSYALFRLMSGLGRGCVKTRASQECAELFSQFPSSEALGIA